MDERCWFHLLTNLVNYPTPHIVPAKILVNEGVMSLIIDSIVRGLETSLIKPIDTSTPRYSTYKNSVLVTMLQDG